MAERLKLPACLEDAQIKSLPSAAFYIPDFITAEEEQMLLHKVGKHISRLCSDGGDCYRSLQPPSPDGNNCLIDVFKHGPLIWPRTLYWMRLYLSGWKILSLPGSFQYRSLLQMMLSIFSATAHMRAQTTFLLTSIYQSKVLCHTKTAPHIIPSSVLWVLAQVCVWKYTEKGRTAREKTSHALEFCKNQEVY